MGVSGTGKTSLGKQLSQQTTWPFYDADDFHSKSNKDKMKLGLGLEDSDRIPWLSLLAQKIKEWSKKGEAILACSALKEDYRSILSDQNSGITWVVLNGSFKLIQARLKNRKNHFFDPRLLHSQFSVLELPSYGIYLNIEKPLPEMSATLLKKINPSNSATIGVIGMGVMGQGIALNCAENNFSTAVYNRLVPGEERVIDIFISNNSQFKNVFGFTELSHFIDALERPRKIWVMIKSGSAVDKLVDELLPLLNEGDVLVDGGNSHYSDTQRRFQVLEKRRISFSGCGVSGGALGARHGASLMFGGSSKAYRLLSPVLNRIAAKDILGNPCHAYMGIEGAGHFVKMIHNGIEYVEMQLLAETFSLLSRQMNYPEIVSVFNEWNTGSEASYLLEITAKILEKKEGDHFLIDLILDQSSNKGTGMWSSSAALALGEVNSMMTSAVFSRYLSLMKAQRTVLSQSNPQIGKSNTIELSVLKKAYGFARKINHIQGFNLIEQATKIHGWEYKPSEIARVWTQGCIIRSNLMEQLVQFFSKEKKLLQNTKFIRLLTNSEPDAAAVIHHAVDQKIALDCYSSAYNYWIALCTETLPANLIQAQRDFFGAHTYQRVDKPLDQYFHTQWQQND
ncbi:MAG: NADP-dependent phosphogluconate dehydrogenase [Flavobacteriaceae bacterium]|nr:NADP-dependent phosphogluconate dehydrogenase [Flavobacteriaceae bacterium]